MRGRWDDYISVYRTRVCVCVCVVWGLSKEVVFGLRLKCRTRVQQEQRGGGRGRSSTSTSTNTHNRTRGSLQTLHCESHLVTYINAYETIVTSGQVQYVNNNVILLRNRSNQSQIFIVQLQTTPARSLWLLSSLLLLLSSPSFPLSLSFSLGDAVSWVLQLAFAQ